ncbi:ELMO domain-containing protein 1, variant 2 [Schistosoma haematobium]|uniref:ELMO domain-containing protein 1, variant 2 n=1 Tax=Schistosoma haematobium TaxID=6185 RepID=A0A922LH94_SCHHA|nr:ELMO domain-containing protein 1, variant 2 [Schistosoma haematobium]KAH9583729.1 ELMO domain-containing protein 1, variant 2 [Schistosoma haematobium]
MNFLTYIFVYLFQYISRLVTGRCELSRIIADCPKGAPRTVRIENSLRNSKNKSIQNGLLLGKCTDAKSHVQLVISAKRIDLKDQPKYYHIHKLMPVFLPIICTASVKSTLIGN